MRLRSATGSPEAIHLIRHRYSLHLLFKPEHTIKTFTLIMVLLSGFRIVRIRMMAVEELDDILRLIVLTCRLTAPIWL